MKKTFLLVALLLIMLWGCQKGKTHLFPVPSFLIWGFSVEGFPSQDSLEKLEQETKISPQLVQFYLQWPSSLDHFKSIISSLEAITNIGAIPCLTWEPMAIINLEEKTISYELILNGHYDSYLKHIAKEIKEWDKPLLIRFAHEMNLSRYHWGTSKEQFGSESPLIYKKMFQYLVNFFNQENVRHVFWVFCPNVDSVPNESWNKVALYYPGDEYVDILGMDGYNWAITPEMVQTNSKLWVAPWRSFEEIFKTLHTELRQIAPHKPIMVFETATANRETRRKNSWIAEALKTAKKWNLLGIIWFQVKKEEDWRIQHNDDEDKAYIPMIKSTIPPFQEWLLNYGKGRHSN